jgi:hypothetical protein
MKTWPLFLLLTTLTPTAQTLGSEPESSKGPELIQIAGLKADLQLEIGTGFIIAGSPPMIMTSKSITSDCITLAIARDDRWEPVETWWENAGNEASSIPLPKGWEPSENRLLSTELEAGTEITAHPLPLTGFPRPYKGKLTDEGTARFEEELPKEAAGAPITAGARIVGFATTKRWSNEMSTITAKEIKDHNKWTKVESKLTREETKQLSKNLASEPRTAAERDPLTKLSKAFETIVKERKDTPPWVAAVKHQREKVMTSYEELEQAQKAVDWSVLGSPTEETVKAMLEKAALFEKAGRQLAATAKTYETEMWGALQKSYPAHIATPKMMTTELLTKPLGAYGEGAASLAGKTQTYLKAWLEGTQSDQGLEEIRAENSVYGNLKIEAVTAVEGSSDS